jgi:S-adenosylmethionine:tRNA ribosyltransferase-isomerase
MKLSDFNFSLPEDRIARFPAQKRDESRLMVVDRTGGTISHHLFRDLPDFIGPSDFLVVNNSKVEPVKLFGAIRAGAAEILITNRIDNESYEVFALPAKKFKMGVTISFGDHLQAEVVGIGQRGKRTLKFNGNWQEIMSRGFAPLPPYIKRKSQEAHKHRDFDLERYQTVYAGKGSSIAAPTAGLHFSLPLLQRLKERTEILEVTLDVGETTFQKIEVEDVADHRMGSERITIPREVMDRVKELKLTKRLVAVGTTSVRSLETFAAVQPDSETFESRLFIYPGFEFKLVDSLITNFHLPESSLFILVCALAGIDLMQEAYRKAIENDYRFFSYGDAMLIK